jgi:hypothetical protein
VPAPGAIDMPEGSRNTRRASLSRRMTVLSKKRRTQEEKGARKVL